MRQRDPLSPTLFNLVLEFAIRGIAINPGGNMYNKLYQHLAFADDICMIARRPSSLTDAFDEFLSITKNIGLQINESKTKFMKSGGKGGKLGENILLMEYKFERTETFKYLGSIVTKDNNIKTEIQARLMAGNRSYYALENILKSKSVSRKIKLNIYKTMIRPIVMYGSETWPITKAEEQLIDVWERKVLRRIFGPVYDGNTWRIRTNGDYTISMAKQTW